MRTSALLLAVFLCLPGCVTVTTGASRRVALVPSPGAPPQLRGSPGIGLATRIPLVDPDPGRDGNGIAVPVFQPELNGVFRFAEHAYGSLDVNFALGADTYAARPDLPRVQADLSLGALLGGGYDFQMFKLGGFNLSAEGGFNFVTVTTTINGVSAGLSNILLFAGRAALSPYLEIRAFRLFLGGVVSTDVWSEAQGFATTCTAGCTIADTARTELTGLLMIGGGARFQPSRMFSVGFEFWLPLTTAGVRHPPQLLLALQMGDFDFSRSRRGAAQPDFEVEPQPRRREPEPFVPMTPPPLPEPPELTPVPVPL